MNKPRSNASEFWSKVKKSSSCWLWTGGVSDARGYPVLYEDGRRIQAHRMAWELINGCIPGGRSAFHCPESKLCVRPDHIVVHDRCSVAGCEKLSETRGFCGLHYQRWRRYGDPKVTVRFKTFEEKLEKRTDRVGGCLIWKGAVVRTGYGVVRHPVNGKAVLVHRLVYELANGEIEDGLDICHSCDVKLCIEPRHLFSGSRKQNMEDASKKGRLRKLRQRCESEILIKVSPDSTASFVYTEKLDLSFLGRVVSMTRLTDVEWNSEAGRWEAIDRSNGRIIAAHSVRSKVIEAEVEYFQQEL